MNADRNPETLPASWYYDEAVYRREREAIFARNWSLLARTEQLPGPGDFVAGEVAGYPVFVVRDRDSRLKGFHNVCRHRAGPVVSATAGHCDVLRCAYHGWTYDLDGRLHKAPGFAASDGFDPAEFGLVPLRVESWNGLVFVCLDEAAPGLVSWLGEIAAVAERFAPLSALRFFREDAVEGAANWKTYGDNSAEGYHLPFVHRGLSRALDKAKTTIAAYPDGKFVGFDVRYRDEDGRDAGPGFWIYKFPGLLLHFSERGFNLERVIPLDARRIRLVRWFWLAAAVADDAEAAEALVAESTAVMREDLGICEAVQRNLEAGIYRSGVLSREREPGTVFFQQLVREALE